MKKLILALLVVGTMAQAEDNDWADQYLWNSLNQPSQPSYQARMPNPLIAMFTALGTFNRFSVINVQQVFCN